MKSSELIKELQRSLNRLDRLEGTAIRCVDGPHLLWVDHVTDPRPLLDACERHGAPTLEALRQGLQLSEPPVRLTARALAAAHRDLRVLETVPGVIDLIREAPRYFRGHGPIDRAWIDRHRARLEALSRLVPAGPEVDSPAPGPAPAASPPPDAPPFMGPVLELVQALHGEDQRRGLEVIAARSLERGRNLRRDLKRRLEGLAHRLEAPRLRGQPDTPLDRFLDETARTIEGLDRLPGRARGRRFPLLLRAVVAWPAAPASHEAEGAGSSHPALPPGGWAARVRAAIPGLLEGIESPRAPLHLIRLHRTLALYGLLFRLAPDGPDALSFEDVKLALRHFDAVRETLAGRPLSFAQALALPRLDLSSWNLRQVADWVAGGLELPLLQQVAALGQLNTLLQLEGPADAARAFCRWITVLVPHYRNLGITLELNPRLFARLGGGRGEDPGVLAHCLLTHHGPSPAGQTEQHLAALDATLGLFGRLPAQARTLVQALDATAPGLGRATFPAFAAWLDDDPLLDRFCYLSRLAGQPPALSSTLLADFTRESRMAGERAWLEALPTPTEAQRRRLDRLIEAVPPSPAWTRRRLADRIQELLARAYQVKLDALLQGLLRDAFGIQVPALTPAWRDAVRFYLTVDKNQEWLELLLRFAAAHPARPIAATRPQNRAWLEKAAARMNVDAWLAPRRTYLDIDGRRYTLATEEDPLEVLRMGIPFNTCLSLLDGFNAAATIVNALDANKRVLYLRDEKGTIVARKLIAVSSDYSMLGYRLYLSLDPVHEPLVDAAFDQLCRTIAAESGLPLAGAGVPDTLHPGFWYDDGVDPFAIDGGQPDLEAWCEAHHRPVPRHPSSALMRQVQAWQGVQTGDVDRVLAAFSPWDMDVALAAAGEWAVARIGEKELIRRAKEDRRLIQPVLHTLRHHPVHLIRTAALFLEHSQQAAYARGHLLAHLPSMQIAQAWIDLAELGAQSGRRADDHGLEHGTFLELQRHLEAGTIEEMLAACDRLEPVWDWILRTNEHCSWCRTGGTYQLKGAMEVIWSRAPSPRAVLDCLRDRRRTRLAHQMALHIAARYPLHAHPPPGGSARGAARRGAPPGEAVVARGRPGISGSAGPSATARIPLLERLTRPPQASPLAVQALRHLRASRPDLEAEPALLAAFIRQAAPETEEDWQALEPLPVPGEAPFHELGDLLYHLEGLDRVLERWTPTGPIGDWNPGYWERYYHRRYPTRWKRRLERLVAAGQEGAKEASAALALFRPPPKSRARVQPANYTGPEEMREAIRALLEAGMAPEPHHAAAVETLSNGDLEAMDGEALLEVMANPDHTIPEPLREEIISLLLQEAARQRWGLSERLFVRLWQRESRRDDLLHLLDTLHRYFVYATLSRLEAAARRFSPPLPLDGLYERWIVRILEDGKDINELTTTTDRTRQETLIEVALAQPDPKHWLELYKLLYDPTIQARFLDRLAEKPPEALEALRPLIHAESWWGDPKHEDFEWLEAAVGKAPAGAEPGHATAASGPEGGDRAIQSPGSGRSAPE